LAQAGFMHEHPEVLGEKGLAEWDKATKGMHLPQHVPQHARKAILVNHKHLHKNKGHGKP